MGNLGFKSRRPDELKRVKTPSGGWCYGSKRFTQIFSSLRKRCKNVCIVAESDWLCFRNYVGYGFLFFLCGVFLHSSLLSQVITETFGSGTNTFSIKFVQIGNLNNPARTVNTNSGTTLSGSFIPADPKEVGAVNYTYNIGKYEISRGVIEKYNSLSPIQISLGDLSLYGGSSGNISNRPATRISWNQAARFVNWLNTSKGYHEAYYFPTSGPNDNIAAWPGIYIGLIGVTSGNDYSGYNRFRHPDAYYFLPSVNEWYKAAYSGPDGTWYNYANGSNSPPLPTSGGNIGVVYGGYPVIGPADVENAGELSMWGTMAQIGNAEELTESAIDGLFSSPNEMRAILGGSWGSGIVDGLNLQSSLEPTGYYNYAGFRVASVPEPSALSLLAVGLGGLAMIRRRRS